MRPGLVSSRGTGASKELISTKKAARESFGGAILMAAAGVHAWG